MKNKEKKKVHIVAVLMFIMFGVTGFFVGYVGLDSSVGDALLVDGFGVLLVDIVVILICLYLAQQMQIIVHEGGHFIMGKLTGYKLVSFRIGSMMFMKENGHIVCKKYSISTTGGQCLMLPPPRKDGNFPYVLYNFGGAIANAALTIICLILYCLLPQVIGLSTLLVLSAIMGIYIALMNAIPLKIGIPNDGYNTMEISKSVVARNAFWEQLYINAHMTGGERLRDMSDDLFVFPKIDNLKGPISTLVCGSAVMCIARYHDCKEFALAKERTEFLLKQMPDILGVYKCELMCELMFYEIMGECSVDKIDEIYTTTLKKYIKATQTYISRKRLMYAYERIVTKNETAAKSQLEAFYKTFKTYPFAGDIQAEKELVEIIDAHVESLA